MIKLADFKAQAYYKYISGKAETAMSTEVGNGLEAREVALRGCTDAARFVVLSRKQSGNDTAYDHFLFDYIGEANSSFCPPITCTSPRGAVYEYNNVLTMHRSFTREGTLLNIRHVEDSLSEHDENYEYFVATANLEAGETTVWRVLQTEKEASPGRSTVVLLLARRPAAEIVDTGTDSQNLRPDRVEALVILDNQRGVSFLDMAAGRGFEKLHSIAELMSEVNNLTDQLAIGLDRREQAGQQLGRLIPMQRMTA